MIEILGRKIEEIGSQINDLENRLAEINRICKMYGCQYDYYEEYAEIYVELNKLQFALNILSELQEA
jgi:DNA repair ATPase RecN